MSGRVHVVVDPADGGARLDRWCRARLPGLGHGGLHRLLRTGTIRVDGRRAGPGTRLVPGQVVRLPDPGGSGAPDVLYEDDHLLVVDKPAGLAVQRGPGVRTALQDLLGDRDGAGGHLLVHRLDRDTSGCLVLARGRRSAAALAAHFRAREVLKEYWALVEGEPPARCGTVTTPVGRARWAGDRRPPVAEARPRSALTRYAVVATTPAGLTWLTLQPVTGRTHQLRVHTAGLGAPVVGDHLHGSGRPPGDPRIADRLHLHARRVVVPHPVSGRVVDVTAPLPAHMRRSWAALGLPLPDRPAVGAP